MPPVAVDGVARMAAVVLVAAVARVAAVVVDAAVTIADRDTEPEVGGGSGEVAVQPATATRIAAANQPVRHRTRREGIAAP